MGIYINPKGQTKESFLLEHGREVPQPNFLQPINPAKSDEVLVCLVKNSFFTAAAVAFDQAELEEFVQPEDKRKKIWYILPKSCLSEKVLKEEDLKRIKRQSTKLQKLQQN